MKTMTCKQLGGACDLEFQADTFEQMAELSQKHGNELFQQGDEAHLKAMREMQALMQSPDKMKQWFEARKKEFEALFYRPRLKRGCSRKVIVSPHTFLFSTVVVLMNSVQYSNFVIVLTLTTLAAGQKAQQR